MRTLPKTDERIDMVARAALVQPARANIDSERAGKSADRWALLPTGAVRKRPDWIYWLCERRTQRCIARREGGGKREREEIYAPIGRQKRQLLEALVAEAAGAAAFIHTVLLRLQLRPPVRMVGS